MDMAKKKDYAQVRIYKSDRDKFAVQAKRKRITLAELIHSYLLS